MPVSYLMWEHEHMYCTLFFHVFQHKQGTGSFLSFHDSSFFYYYCYCSAFRDSATFQILGAWTILILADQQSIPCCIFRLWLPWRWTKGRDRCLLSCLILVETTSILTPMFVVKRKFLCVLFLVSFHVSFCWEAIKCF